MSNDYKEFDTVQEIIDYLENEYNITVLSIRDYGSRAWNLDSETSDMDAGMVFAQEPIKYIELGGYTENIDRTFMLGGEEFEIIGWNIKRFAELLNKSNPSMIEWLNSDITYYEHIGEEKYTKYALKEEDINVNHGILDEIKEHANQEFKPISLFYHYRSMAKSNFEKYIENRNDLSIKRHLYILRGLTYARYVEQTHEMPPLNYTEFYENKLPELVGENQFMPNWIYKQLGEFIRLKKNGDGSRTHGDEELWDWMRDELSHKLDHEDHDIRGIDRGKLNTLIKHTIQ